jgi:hypothetical protein
MSYLLESWEIYCACNPDCSSRFVDHLGALLVQVESWWICCNNLNLLICSAFRLFSGFCLIALLKIHYLLSFWVIVHACQLVDSENLIDHHGGLLVQRVDLQEVLQ